MSRFSKITWKTRIFAMIGFFFCRSVMYFEALQERQERLAHRAQRPPAPSLPEAMRRKIMMQDALERTSHDKPIPGNLSFKDWMESVVASPLVTVQLLGGLESTIAKYNGAGTLTVAFECSPVYSEGEVDFDPQKITARVHVTNHERKKIMDTTFGVDQGAVNLLVDEFINAQESKGYRISVREKNYFEYFKYMVGHLEDVRDDDVMNFRIILTPVCGKKPPSISFAATMYRKGTYNDSLPMLLLSFDRPRRKRSAPTTQG